MRTQLAEAIAERDLHRLQHLNETAGGRLGDDAGLIDGGDEGRRAAVHDRNFGTVDFDDGVVDAHAAQGSEHMFRGGNQRTFTVPENGCKVGGDYGFRDRGNFAIGIFETAADKNKTCIQRCRSENQTYWKTGMNADAGHSGLRPKRCLPAKLHAKSPHHRT